MTSGDQHRAWSSDAVLAVVSALSRRLGAPGGGGARRGERTIHGQNEDQSSW